MSEPVKSRAYRSSVRAEQARRTRQAIPDAPRRLFAAWLAGARTRLFLTPPEA